MKKSVHFTSATLLVILCGVLFSFAPLAGAHNYQVYLDDKLVLERYADPRKEVPSLSLDPSGDYKQLSVRYSECGRTVSARIISIKDDGGKLLKEWKFDGSSKGFENPMDINVKDVLALKQKNSNSLKLYYASREFPEGQIIASLRLEK